jgi:hypothetical protein
MDPPRIHRDDLETHGEWCRATVVAMDRRFVLAAIKERIDIKIRIDAPASIELPGVFPWRKDLLISAK